MINRHGLVSAGVCLKLTTPSYKNIQGRTRKTRQKFANFDLRLKKIRQTANTTSNLQTSLAVICLTVVENVIVMSTVLERQPITNELYKA